jgi:hypothetical protein
MRVFDVFTPTGVPTVTYVERPGHNLEIQLKNALNTPGQIVSLSGPSKSGKTVLINKVIPRDTLISVSGAAIPTAERLWERVLNWMDAPSEVTSGSDDLFAATIGMEGGGKAGIPFVAEGSAKASGSASYTHSNSTSARRTRGGIDQVVKDLEGSDFVVFVDDFHYMSPETQTDVARQIKEVAEKGVKVCTASVPHRADDVVRSNPELRGRVKGIDLDYWNSSEVELIGKQGFSELNMGIAPDIIAQMASESFGSPQLMQQICLQLCFATMVDERLDAGRPIPVNANQLRRIYQQASTTTDFSSLVESLHAGPKQHGTRRTIYDLVDGTRGDVYRCILMALTLDPPRLTLTYDDLYNRVKRTGKNESPAGSSVAQALEQISELAASTERSAVVEWRDDILDVVDPYFLFYLRQSPRLTSLGASRE